MLLQDATQSLCGYDDGECFALRKSLIPNTEIRDVLVQTTVCSRLLTRAGCDVTDGCVWRDGECAQDFTQLLAACLVEEWVTVRRSIECADLGTEEKCEILKGCSWNGMLCEKNDEDVTQALQANPDLATAYSQAVACSGLSGTACPAPCEVGSTGNCFFPGPTRTVNWFNDNDSAFCRFSKQDFACVAADPPNCPAGCASVGEIASGVCFTTVEAQVELAYESDPSLGDLILNAIDVCPTFDDKFTCESFTG